ncbi:hypothetical protein HYR99_22725 [Candidatus Poribacteria bacterium]|nr:hypothetical protein [Candidatus Poribacteria bacterium]
MNQYVTDTHPLLWYILSDARLSPTARSVFAGADAGVHQILIPTIVLVEAVYLAEKKRINPAAVEQLFYLLDLVPARGRGSEWTSERVSEWTSGTLRLLHASSPTH